MSLISERSPRHCADKQGHNFSNMKLVIYMVVPVFLTIFALIFLVWLNLNPKNPKFSITKAEIITNINLTSSNYNIPFLISSSTILLSLQSINPNQQASIYYDNLTLYVSYNDHKIVPEISIRRFHQDCNAVTDIPISALFPIERDVARSFGYDAQLDGRIISLDFEIMGRLRWKVGKIATRRHSFSVNCSGLMMYGLKPSTLLGSSEAVPCRTKVLKA